MAVNDQTPQKDEPPKKDVSAPADHSNEHQMLLGSVSLTDQRAADLAMFSKTPMGIPGEFTLTDGNNSIGTDSSKFKKGPDNAADSVKDGTNSQVREKSGLSLASETLQRSDIQIKNVESVLTDKQSSDSDLLRAAGVLASNGIQEVKSRDGASFDFNINEDRNVSLKSTNADGVVRELSGIISSSGNALEGLALSHPKEDPPQVLEGIPRTDTTSHPPDGGDRQKPPNEGDKKPPQTDAEKKQANIDTLFDPTKSQEDKLRAARDLADHGNKKIVGPDGKSYEIGIHKYGSRESVSIFQQDGHNHSHMVLRGIVDDHGKVSKQRDRHGNEVDYQGHWGKAHPNDNNILRHDEPKGQDTPPKGQDTPPKGQDTPPKGQDTPPTPPKGQDNPPRDNPPGKDKPSEITKPTDTTDDPNKKLEQSEDRLKKAADNIKDETQRAQFLKDMSDFKDRASKQGMKPEEITGTYDQMSRLLEAKDGAVPVEQRQLAAMTFAHHVADPTNIDQGQHNTCNVTSLEEHMMTRSPSKMAEMVSTMAITGGWTAPDGKQIKIDKGSLTPGPEERNNPPLDNERSYATQLMNLGLANDIAQRRMPPEFYSQEKPNGPGDLGERLRFADGKDVTENDINHNGKTGVWNRPDVHCQDISDAATRLNGDTGFVIANQKADGSDHLVHINNAQDLANQLTDMNNKGRMPAILLVDVNKPPFGNKPGQPPSWHVLSVTSYDPKTGNVKISNQWGKNNDITTDINTLYNSTTP